MKLLLILTIVIPSLAFTCKEGLNSPLVFDPAFYLGAYPQLGELEEAEVEQHWCQQEGVRLGRQGTSAFHSLQYLINYPDLQEEFGEDFEAAIQHYVTIGHAEGRKGYVEGGAFGRWTVEGPEGEGGKVYLSTSDRMAGAVDSLAWNNKEFINNHDHGRQMQMAMADGSGMQECWNPTEAGSSKDSKWLTSSSVLETIRTAPGELKTWIRPAYYQPAMFPWGSMYPHQHCCKNKTWGADCSYNDHDTHDGIMYKIVTIGCFSLPGCIKWESSAELGLGEDRPEGKGGHLTSPSTHLVGDIRHPYILNTTTGKLEALEVGWKGHSWEPIIMATEDMQYALGHYTTPYNVDRYNFNWYMVGPHTGPTFLQSVNNLAVVFHRDYSPGDVYQQVTYVCVGSLEDVVVCLLTAADNAEGS